MDWIVRAGLIKVPDDIPFEQAAFIEPVNTCFKAIRMLALEADDTVLVIGQGSIGVILAALARRTGATVLTSDLVSGAARDRGGVWVSSADRCARRCRGRCEGSDRRSRGGRGAGGGWAPTR